MELSYKVRAADGTEHGPATAEQLTAWIREGRVVAHQQVQRSDMQHWAAAGEFTELRSAFGTAAPPLTSAPLPGTAGGGADPGSIAQLRSGASWFYWIAGLSLINSIAAFSGGSWRFLFGLGVTQLFDRIASGMGSGKMIALLLDFVAAGALVALGIFANKRQTWAFIVGIVLLLLDGGLQLLGGDWIGAAFHAYVLFRLFIGMQACRGINNAS
jgi:hypothetical protein